MAERRMFTDKITDADAFTSMPSSAQALYLHINMHADDDGFCNQLKLCKVNANASEDDLKLLVAKNYIFFFESGVVVVKHWRMHNLLRKDRYKETQYTEEKSRLYLKENGAYTLDEFQGKKIVDNSWQPKDNQRLPQDRIGKDSIEENIYAAYLPNKQDEEEITLNACAREEVINRLKAICDWETIEPAFAALGTTYIAERTFNVLADLWEENSEIISDNLSRALFSTICSRQQTIENGKRKDNRITDLHAYVLAIIKDTAQ